MVENIVRMHKTFFQNAASFFQFQFQFLSILYFRFVLIYFPHNQVYYLIPLLLMYLITQLTGHFELALPGWFWLKKTVYILGQ